MEYTARITDHAAIARTAAAGSMVLLKNTGNTLPLVPAGAEPLPVAVLGIGQIFTACCQQEMTPWHTVNILEGLCACGTVRPDSLLSHKYRNWALEHPDKTPLPLATISMEELAENNAAALLVITRSQEDYLPKLTEDELAMVRMASGAFEKTVLILNTPGYMELDEAAQCCTAIVFMGVAGQESGHALADVLTAKLMPSGRLAHSWPRKLDSFAEATEVLDGFSGYRYFDSFNLDILYPFGYGLGYGKSELGSVSMGLDGCEVVVSAEVCNTGETWPLQEVVQVYVSRPSGRWESPCYILDCFAKTGVLQPGETQLVQLRFPVTELSSFQEEASAYVLTDGYYDIRIGTSCRNTCVAGSLRVTRSVVVQAVTPMDMGAALSRSSGQGFTYPGETEELEQAHKRAIRLSDRNLKRIPKKKGGEFTGCRSDGKPHILQDVQRGWCSLFQLIASMDDESLRKLVCDFGFCPSDVPGALGASSDLRGEYGIPPLNIAAGSCGLQLTRDLRDEDDAVTGHQYCTAFPAASLMACSFDPELIRAVGKAIGREMAEYGIDLWLAPGVNLQRTPLQKQFGECWSEDPVLSGICAMAMAEGVQPNGAAVLRSVGGSMSVKVSQHAWRDMYALGFEIACHAYRAALIPVGSLNGQVLGEDGPTVKSMLVDWKYTGMFLADGERYVASPSRVMLEKSALRILKLILESKKV